MRLALSAVGVAALLAAGVVHAAWTPPDAWLAQARCVHQHEAPWSANTGNGYFGGLQMDYGFMRTYGSAYLARYGTADHWPPAVQIAVAIRAYASGRGFYPWPNTARACGLL